MKVKELIEELKKHNPDAENQTITTGNMNEWNYTNTPTFSTHKNMFGEWVYIK